MCWQECFVNQHRKCGHFILLYYSGVTTDCQQPTCGLSAAHMHKTAKNCGCTKVWQDQMKRVNLIQEACDPCKEAAMDALVRSGR
ncbi:hypothetical protein BXZ70DRAFT_205387 [Cristinia sonorae]|uniref:Uncharacterized protein n=1 Tax=Cristinia sonorae TaxID=1940300 RepID=A0A8K0XPM5_9AGAR|nr:hypothetical protein BXZ70DRAFT_205387 [Cristinia sonorae]